VPQSGEVSEHRLTGPGRHDPPRLLAFVGAHAIPGLEAWDGATYARTLSLPGGPGIAAVTAADGGYDVTLHLLDPADRPAAIDRLRHLLAVDRDGADAEAHLARDPLLAPLVARRPGLRPPGSVDHAETLVRTVIGQQVSLAGARALGARLVAAHGRSLPPDWLEVWPGLAHAWPTAAVLAALDPADPALAMPARRARTVVAAARAVAGSGESLPPAAELLALPGVGPWTSDYVDLRCRAAPDVFLAGDLAVRRALERLGLAAVSPRSAASRAAAWTPHRSVALMHLWADYLGL
jgi:AraC family transcriptional regulator of adaptative response / DNA-3-methyladenine glycosylase II